MIMTKNNSNWPSKLDYCKKFNNNPLLTDEAIQNAIDSIESTKESTKEEVDLFLDSINFSKPRIGWTEYTNVTSKMNSKSHNSSWNSSDEEKSMSIEEILDSIVFSDARTDWTEYTNVTSKK